MLFRLVLKGNLVKVQDCSAAVSGNETVAKLPNWTADYNSVRRHMGLNMMSPSEYGTLNQTA